ncbi:hypothetical protein SH668x_001291 [Planctomicrobium sp. SH668]|uniref:hypothetical protein n=1 Tax=Planctomicrobium sp. SH668 TaxID=3448126 RepID=UPI003F5C29ED
MPSQLDPSGLEANCFSNLPDGTPIWAVDWSAYPTGTLNANIAHLNLYDFYLGGDFAGGIRPGYYSGVEEGVVVSGQLLLDIANEPGRIAVADAIRGQLKQQAMAMSPTSTCDTSTQFKSCGAELMQPIRNDVLSTNLGLAFGKYYVYWNATCELSHEVKGESGCFRSWKCSVKWTFYDYYNLWVVIPPFGLTAR